MDLMDATSFVYCTSLPVGILVHIVNVVNIVNVACHIR